MNNMGSIISDLFFPLNEGTNLYILYLFIKIKLHSLAAGAGHGSHGSHSDRLGGVFHGVDGVRRSIFLIHAQHVFRFFPEIFASG